jgi:hypothetical protein
VADLRPDLYRLLRVERDATPREIRDAYRRLARRWHPDVNPDPAAAEHMGLINQAFETLSDPAKRAEYDLTLGHGEVPQEAPARGGRSRAGRAPRPADRRLMLVAGAIGAVAIGAAAALVLGGSSSDDDLADVGRYLREFAVDPALRPCARSATPIPEVTVHLECRGGGGSRVWSVASEVSDSLADEDIADRAEPVQAVFAAVTEVGAWDECEGLGYVDWQGNDLRFPEGGSVWCQGDQVAWCNVREGYVIQAVNQRRVENGRFWRKVVFDELSVSSKPEPASGALGTCRP